jgi:hypothetical protein
MVAYVSVDEANYIKWRLCTYKNNVSHYEKMVKYFLDYLTIFYRPRPWGLLSL